MNIVYSSSDAYAECTGISIWSLFEKNKHVQELAVYILDTDISAENRERLLSVARSFNRTIIFISAVEGFKKGAEELNLPLMRGSYNTYSRVLMNMWFSNLDKVLVIDSDTLVTGNIQPLWDIDLTGRLIAAVPEIAMYGKYNNLEESKIINNSPLYYNMGICLINLKDWREKKIDELIKQKINEEKPELRIADQSIINMYLNQFIKRIDLKYNYYSVVHGVSYKTIIKIFQKKIVFSESEYLEASNNPAIIHYFGHSFERPWFKYNGAYMKDEYMTVRSLTPWNNSSLQKWKKTNSLILDLYDILSYLLLLLGFRNCCLKFRYIYGQRLKEITGIHR